MVKTVVNKENRGSSFRGLESWVWVSRVLVWGEINLREVLEEENENEYRRKKKVRSRSCQRLSANNKNMCYWLLVNQCWSIMSTSRHY